MFVQRWRPQWICQSCRLQQRHQLRKRHLSTTIQTKVEKPYYVTTPIFYVNAAPHVGHMYTMILTDVLKRWQVLKNRQAIMCTGTDEHGMKIQQAAAKAGLPPKEFCDSGADVFKNLANSIDISNDIFIRTTDRKHVEAVEYAWQMLQEKGWIYESKHEGWYSVSDETFYPQGQVQLIVDPPTGRKMMVSVETGKEVEWTSERNYHFRLSAFRERLLDFYNSNPEFVVPRTRMNEVVAQVKAGLEDLSISRPVERLTWGIRVPTDNSQTMYVWLDALMNYATAVGYPFSPNQEHVAGFPPDVHVIGKDIVRFHCIYWPAILMALDLPLPKHVLTHAHWTLGKKKMAKSTGNAVNPFFALERFGIDVMRWYLVQDGGITDDADYDNSFIIKKYKKGLQDGLGNLTSRITRGKGWDVQRAVKRYAHPNVRIRAAIFEESSEYGRKFYDRLGALPAQVDSHMRDLLPNRALQEIMGAVYDMNVQMQVASPWALDGSAETPTSHQLVAEIDRAIYMAAETLRLVGIMLQPFIPTSSERLLDMIGVRKDRRDWEWCVLGKDDEYGKPMVDLGKGEQGVLFPRLSSAF
ncbi:hypothetical protein M433DRAFT_56688 [Acidomyces richmondensis BFW]|nr:MAG: hypothetical protein FE78DRAFT_141545 [Acidomyces sp. 'richmondensis']KYG50665.1 hypothetical protein M433DRAFT_56688 [Acidomyces richmondensis BFW]